jgi:hypothetical protein
MRPGLSVDKSERRILRLAFNAPGDFLRHGVSGRDAESQQAQETTPSHLLAFEFESPVAAHFFRV